MHHRTLCGATPRRAHINSAGAHGAFAASPVLPMILAIRPVVSSAGEVTGDGQHGWRGSRPSWESPHRLRAGRITRTACPPAATAPRFATPSLRPPRLVPARVHHRTSVCGRARRCAQINTDRSNGASGAASDAADDLAASMQVGRVSVFIGGLVLNRMILLLAMIPGQSRRGRGEGPGTNRQQPERVSVAFRRERESSRRGCPLLPSWETWPPVGASTSTFPCRRTPRRITRPFSGLTR